MKKKPTPPRDPKADALARKAFADGKCRTTAEIVSELRKRAK